MREIRMVVIKTSNRCIPLMLNHMFDPLPLEKPREIVADDTLVHISLLPYKHELQNGTYFIEDE